MKSVDLTALAVRLYEISPKKLIAEIPVRVRLDERGFVHLKASYTLGFLGETHCEHAWAFMHAGSVCGVRAMHGYVLGHATEAEMAARYGAAGAYKAWQWPSLAVFEYHTTMDELFREISASKFPEWDKLK
jgi:hypothetical protein